MTWALTNPAGEGDFSPAIEFTDIDSRINDHFRNNMTDNERAVFDNRAIRFQSSTSRKYADDLGWLRDFEVPTEIRFHRTYKNLGSIIKTLNQLLVVDRKMMDIIDELEPGVHQFWQMNVTMPKSKVADKDLFGMVIHNHLDGFRPSESDEDSCEGKPSMYSASIGAKKKEYSGLAISKDAVSGSHIWRDKQMFDPPIFVSDELMTRIKAAELRIFRHFKLKDV